MKYLLYFFTFPSDVVAIPVTYLIGKLFGTGMHREGLCFITELSPHSWPMDPTHPFPLAGWYSKWAGTTLGHGIVYRPSPDQNTRVHEHVHVQQLHVSMVSSFFLGLLVLLITGKIMAAWSVWSAGYLVYILSNFAVAAIKGEDPYMGSPSEKHAYAIGTLHHGHKVDVDSYLRF